MAIQKIKKDGTWTSVYGDGTLETTFPLEVSLGGTGADNMADALHNLGIYWGTQPPSIDSPGLIYIQIVE